jgi:hypothetical protein
VGDPIAGGDDCSPRTRSAAIDSQNSIHCRVVPSLSFGRGSVRTRPSRVIKLLYPSGGAFNYTLIVEKAQC